MKYPLLVVICACFLAGSASAQTMQRSSGRDSNRRHTGSRRINSRSSRRRIAQTLGNAANGQGQNQTTSTLDSGNGNGTGSGHFGERRSRSLANPREGTETSHVTGSLLSRNKLRLALEAATQASHPSRATDSGLEIIHKRAARISQLTWKKFMSESVITSKARSARSRAAIERIESQGVLMATGGSQIVKSQGGITATPSFGSAGSVGLGTIGTSDVNGIGAKTVKAPGLGTIEIPKPAISTKLSGLKKSGVGKKKSTDSNQSNSNSTAGGTSNAGSRSNSGTNGSGGHS